MDREECLLSRQPLRPLTSFRFAAVLLVLFWHVGWLRTYQTGYVGVSFFYALSGFILTYNYADAFRRVDEPLLKKFYGARFARIYPVYLLAFLWGALLTPVNTYGGPWTWAGVALANLVLVQSYVPNLAVAFSFDGVAWSLSDEMTFYVLLPWLLAGWNRWARNLRIRHLVWIMAGLWAGLSAFLVPYHSGWQSWIAYIFPGTRLVDFFTGLLAALIFRRTLPSTKGLKASRGRWTMWEAMALVLAWGIVAVGPLAEQSLRFSALYLPAWAVILYVFAHQKGYLAQMLSHPLLVLLGNMSFSFYMIHRLVMRSLQANGWYSYQGPLWQTGLVIAISLALSAVLYRFYEEPVRQRLRQKFSPSRMVRLGHRVGYQFPRR